MDDGLPPIDETAWSDCTCPKVDTPFGVTVQGLDLKCCRHGEGTEWLAHIATHARHLLAERDAFQEAVERGEARGTHADHVIAEARARLAARSSGVED